jgi:hypothetical protein
MHKTRTISLFSIGLANRKTTCSRTCQHPISRYSGSYLGVDAQVFAVQLHGSHWVEDDRMGHPPKLLSFNDPEKSFTLRYYETRVFDRPSSNPAPFMVRTAANVSRNITFQNEVTKGDRNNMWHDGPVATIHRNASFWCRGEQDGSWNGTQSPSQCLCKCPTNAYDDILC